MSLCHFYGIVQTYDQKMDKKIQCKLKQNKKYFKYEKFKNNVFNIFDWYSFSFEICYLQIPYILTQCTNGYQQISKEGGGVSF